MGPKKMKGNSQKSIQGKSWLHVRMKMFCENEAALENVVQQYYEISIPGNYKDQSDLSNLM